MSTLDVVIRQWPRDDAGEAKPETRTVKMPVVPRRGERLIFATPDKGEVKYLVRSVTYMMMNDTAGSIVVDMAEEAGGEEETREIGEIPAAVDTIVP
jgi:hypothetical protein